MHGNSHDPLGPSPEFADLKDRYLRLAADFDNFKKRTRRDEEQQATAGKEAILLELLPALDNLERALASVPSTSVDPLYTGVMLTLQELGQMLHRQGIDAMDDRGQLFNPHRHEAVSVRCDPDQPDQAILELLQRGYRCGKEVFRPAKVVVNDLSYKPGTPDVD